MTQPFTMPPHDQRGGGIVLDDGTGISGTAAEAAGGAGPADIDKVTAAGMRERARRIQASAQTIREDNAFFAQHTPPAGTYARAGAELPPDTLDAVHMRLDALHGRQDDIYAALRDLTAIVAAPAATPVSLGADLRTRLTSRKFWAFVAGLAGTVATAIAAAPDGRVTLGAVAAIVVGYCWSQAREDAARHEATAQVESAHIMTGRRGPPAP
jgi:hypothetical protein